MRTSKLRAVTLRPLTADDADAYQAFRLLELQRSPAAFTSTYEEESARPVSWAAERLAAPGRPDDVVLGAFAGAAELIGTAGLSVPLRRQERHKGTLFGMAVAARATGHGVGRRLVTRLLEEAAARGLLQVGLTVSAGNAAAEALYRSCGFLVWGREPRAVIVAGEPVEKLHMVHLLDDYQPAPDTQRR